MRLSVLLPVYGAETFITRCLDSLFDSASRAPDLDVEVVAVVDASPDGSGDVLAAHAEREPRLRVVHHTVNLGAGRARETALAASTGDYVWFVDPDDWVTPDACSMIGESLRSSPDVVLVGYIVVAEDGKEERPPRRDLPDSLPPEFRPGDVPQVMAEKPTPWTRVFRRRFLTELRMPFPVDPPYDDFPVVLPATAAASSIVHVQEACLFYRQHAGSALRRSGPDHFTIFPQYDLTFARLDLVTPPEVVRRWAFTFMVRHLALILTSQRVPHERRQEFFRRAQAAVRAHRPPGYRAPTNRDRLRVGALRYGRWWMVAAARRLRRQGG